MALTSTVNYDTSGNFTFDSDKVEFTGSPVRAKLKLPNSAIAKNEDFTDDTGFTYDNTLAEFSGGKAQHLLPTTVFCNFNVDEDATAGDGTLTGVLFGDAVVTGGYLDMDGATSASGVEYLGLTGLSALQNTGCVRFRVVPNYTGSPAATNTFFYLSDDISAGGDNNLTCQHLTNGEVRIGVGDSTAGFIVLEDLGTWSPSSGTEYEFELNFDISAGATRLFIDGTQHGSTATDTGTRTNGNKEVHLGTNQGKTQISNHKINEFMIFTEVQHTTTYTKGASATTTYFTSNLDLPAFSYAGAADGAMISYDTLVTTETGAPRYTIKTDSGSFKYWDGAAWSASDATYAQANSKADINTNLATLTDASGALSTTVRAHFPDSDTLNDIDDLTLTITENTTYPTDDPTVLQNSGVITDDLETFVETTATTAGSDDIRYIMQVDGTDKYWTGSAWATSDGTYAQANTPADINTNALTLFPTVIGGTLKIKAFLHSDDGSTRPELETVTFDYNFYNTQSEPTKCTMWGFYRDIAGVGVADATVTFTLKRDKKQYREASDSIVEKSVSTTTDSNGRFEQELIRSSNFTGTGTYQLSITKSTDTLETSKVDGAAIEFLAPDATDENITDLITPTT